MRFILITFLLLIKSGLCFDLIKSNIEPNKSFDNYFKLILGRGLYIKLDKTELQDIPAYFDEPTFYFTYTDLKAVIVRRDEDKQLEMNGFKKLTGQSNFSYLEMMDQILDVSFYHNSFRKDATLIYGSVFSLNYLDPYQKVYFFEQGDLSMFYAGPVDKMFTIIIVYHPQDKEYVFKIESYMPDLFNRKIINGIGFY